MRRTLSVMVLFTTCLSCQKDTDTEPTPILSVTVPTSQTVCFESRSLIRRVADLTGRISFSKEENLYTISRGVPGTYDSVWVGFVCNLPDEYKVLNKQVVFSGEYRKGPDRITTFGGEETYYLFLTAVR